MASSVPTDEVVSLELPAPPGSKKMNLLWSNGKFSTYIGNPSSGGPSNEGP